MASANIIAYRNEKTRRYFNKKIIKFEGYGKIFPVRGLFLKNLFSSLSAENKHYQHKARNKSADMREPCDPSLPRKTLAYESVQKLK